MRRARGKGDRSYEDYPRYLVQDYVDIGETGSAADGSNLTRLPRVFYSVVTDPRRYGDCDATHPSQALKTGNGHHNFAQLFLRACR